MAFPFRPGSTRRALASEGASALAGLVTALQWMKLNSREPHEAPGKPGALLMSTPVEVTISQSGFSPPNIYVLPMNTVRFISGDKSSHTFTVENPPPGRASTPFIPAQGSYTVPSTGYLDLTVRRLANDAPAPYTLTLCDGNGAAMTVNVNLIYVTPDGFQPCAATVQPQQTLNFTVKNQPAEEISVSPQGLFGTVTRFNVPQGSLTPKPVAQNAAGKTGMMNYTLQFEAPQDTIKMMIEVVTGGGNDEPKPRR
jgi:plastocyanin